MDIRYRLSVVLIGISIVIVQSQWVQALSTREVDKIAENITVLIEGPSPGSLGSGVIIKHQGKTYTVVTAYHVVKTLGKYSIVTPNQKRYLLDYTTVKQLPSVDMAIITFTSEESYSVAKLGDSTVASRGMNCYVTGFPGRGNAITAPVYIFTEGKLVANGKPQADGYTLIYNNQTLPGMSGGAVLNDRGELIGIHGRGVESNAEPSAINPNVAVVKTAYNLGIPINTLLSLAPKIDSTLALGTPKTLSQTSKADDFFIQGLNKSEKGQLKAAIADYDQAIRLKPDYAEAYLHRGWVRISLGDNVGARPDFDQAIRISSNYAEAYYGRSLTYIPFGFPSSSSSTGRFDFSQAIRLQISDLDQAIRLKPDYAEALSGRGATRMQIGDQQGAIADFKKAVELYQAQGNDSAVASSQRLLEQLKNMPQLPQLRILGNPSSGLSDKQETGLNSNQAILSKSNNAETYFNQAMARLNTDKQEAIRGFDQAIHLRPNYTDAYLYRGMARSSIKDFRGALADFNQVIQLNPNYSMAYTFRGLVRMNLGDFEGQKADNKKVCQLSQAQGISIPGC